MWVFDSAAAAAAAAVVVVVVVVCVAMRREVDGDDGRPPVNYFVKDAGWPIRRGKQVVVAMRCVGG